MKCELCQKREAEVAVKQAADGQVRELFVCKACAKLPGGAKLPGDAPPVNLLIELLFGAAFALGEEDAAERACPVCGLTRAAFRKQGRLGCDACYAHFAADLAPLLRDMHRGTRHVGKVPAPRRHAVARVALERELAEAVRTQQFEAAAILRDRLRDCPDKDKTATPTEGADAPE